MTEQKLTLSAAAIRDWIASNVPTADFSGKRVLLIVPDATRTAPLPLLFAAIKEHLQPAVTALDVLVALGTHPSMTDEQIGSLLGVTVENGSDTNGSDTNGGDADGGTRFFNHHWDRPEELTRIGTLTKQDTEEVSSGLLSLEVPIEINSRIQDYDVLLVLGPVFPHEVVGFSGGNKYFFPGISGPQLLNFFHWLGALITNVGIIGVKQTPVREVVNQAASMIPNEKRCLTFVVNAQAELYGMFYGTPEDAWDQAADLSARVHIERCPRPFRQILSCAPPMYDELWVAGKCMYKLEPVVADGGELIIYAPHLTEISLTHGKQIEQVGYHVCEYFTKQWDRFRDIPWGVLAHSTHVRGTGTFEDGVEHPRIQVTLASGLSQETCERINLGYRNPADIDIESFADREDEGILLVRKAGERLFRLEDSQ